MMRHEYTLYGSRMSYFAAKLRSYLNYKGIEYREKPFSVYDVRWRLPRKTGSPGIPALQSDSGEWLSDTTIIIDTLEARHPAHSITAATPVQTIASMLIEAWCDDVWLPVAVHTRWSNPENYPLFRREVGSGLAPGAPVFVQNWVVDNTAARFVRSKMRNLGIIPAQIELLEHWTHSMLDSLEWHFSNHEYLFGPRPTIADFALIGPLYGHLYTDPVPRRELIEPRPALKAFIERAHIGQHSVDAPTSQEEIPQSLEPIINTIFEEFFPMVETIAEKLRALVTNQSLVAGDSIPRFIQGVSFPMSSETYTRDGLSYSLWMMQRIKTLHAGLPEDDKAAVARWLAAMGRPKALDIDLGPDLTLDGLGVRLSAK